MGFRDLSRNEIEHFLRAERVVRLAFSSPDEAYVVPVFYTWYEGALCGLTTPGRKTTMGAVNPLTAFQVDSTAATGCFVWSSVTGHGPFEIVEDAAVWGPWAAALRGRMTDAPAWAAQQLQERFARLGMLPWRIRPAALHGRAHAELP